MRERDGCGRMREARRDLLLGLLTLGLGIGLLWARLPPVMLMWETASEANTAGFNIYRTDARTGERTQANVTLIPAQGELWLGTVYRFADEDALLGRQYHYTIEEVELDGSKLLYPASVTLRAGMLPLWLRVPGGLMSALGSALLWRAWREGRQAA